jgi:hypothetical protein
MKHNFEFIYGMVNEDTADVCYFNYQNQGYP